MNEKMKTSSRGIALIQQFERCSLTPYLCPAGIPTIGFGNTLYANGRKVSLSDKAITPQQADTLFNFFLKEFEKELRTLLERPVTQSQWDALMSLLWNVGSFKIGNSILLKKINANPDDPAIRTEFMKWNKASGQPMNGLTKRRKAEAELYFTVV